jgi:hypothetical protein
MPERKKFTPPPLPEGYEPEAPLRETFLYRFSAEDAERFRHLGNLVYQAFVEGDALLPKFSESNTWRELNAALQDLRFTQHFLAVIAWNLEHSSLEADEAKLALAAADVSIELGQLCDRVEAMLR